MAYALKNSSGLFYFLPLLLLVPLVAMQFTTEVNWSVFDFLVMGLLLFWLGSSIEYVRRHVRVTENRMAVIFFLFLLFLLIWAELAVGIFGTVFAGS